MSTKLCSLISIACMLIPAYINAETDPNSDNGYKAHGFDVIMIAEDISEVWVDDNFDINTPGWGVDHFDNIQDALSAVSAGGNISVAAGTYYEHIIWPDKQGIKLASTEGPVSTIIDGNGTGTVITLDVALDANTEVNGFTIRNGVATTDYYDGKAGGGILCINSSPTIQNNIITHNEATYGAGFCGLGLDGSCSPIIRNNTIADNNASAGAGIEFTGPYTCAPLIEFNTIMRNTAKVSSGGIECWGDIHAVLRFNQIANNSALGSFPFGNGGGIMLAEGAELVIYGNLITGNLANVRGGGICCHYSATVRIENSVLSNNTAYEFAGALKCALDSTAYFINCTISRNSPDGVYCYGSSSADISYCTISDNEGDGVFCKTLSTANVNWNNITGNTGYGIQNIDPNVTVNAEYNWWGAPSGPSGVAGGSGDMVSANVDYIPWSFCDVIEPHPLSDINRDCYVNFRDFAIMANDWLKCDAPDDPGCTWMP